MLAVAVAGALPAVHEDAIDAIARHDLFVHRCHEVEVVWPKRTGHPHLRRRPVATRFALRVDGDPVWMRKFRIVIGRVWIGTREDRHPELAAAGNEFAKYIAAGERCAAVVKGHLGGIEGQTASGTEADTVGLCALEV